MSHTNTPGGSIFACSTVKQDGGTAPALHLHQGTTRNTWSVPRQLCVARGTNEFNQTYQVHSSTASQLCGVALPWQGSAPSWVVLARLRLPLSCAAHAVCAAISATTKMTRGSFAMRACWKGGQQCAMPAQTVSSQALRKFSGAFKLLPNYLFLVT